MGNPTVFRGQNHPLAWITSTRSVLYRLDLRNSKKDLSKKISTKVNFDVFQRVHFGTVFQHSRLLDRSTDQSID